LLCEGRFGGKLARMKTKQEVIKDLLERSEESLMRLDIRLGFLQNKMAVEEKKHHVEEAMQLTADKKETEEWIAYLKSEVAKA
jgi:hypothetical protein